GESLKVSAGHPRRHPFRPDEGVGPDLAAGHPFLKVPAVDRTEDLLTRLVVPPVAWRWGPGPTDQGAATGSRGRGGRLAGGAAGGEDRPPFGQRGCLGIVDGESLC